jgi:hypothetical protein
MNQHPVTHDPFANGRSPDQIMFPDQKPRQLFVFGSVAYSLILPKAARLSNLKFPGKIGWFVGYADNSSGYVIFDPITRTMRTRRDVVFDENWRYSAQRPTDDALSGARDYLPANHPGFKVLDTASGSTNPIDLTTDPTDTTPTPTQQFSADPPQTPPDQGGHPTPAQDHSTDQVEPPTVPDQGGQSQHDNIDVPCRAGQPPASTQPDLDEIYVDLFCGTSSFGNSKLTTNSHCKVLAIDHLPESVVRYFIEPEHQHRVTYVRMDLKDLSFKKLTNLVNLHFGTKVGSVHAIHASPPCETFSDAHHGHNPHRDGMIP